jgi:hypothetical protein
MGNRLLYMSKIGPPPAGQLKLANIKSIFKGITPPYAVKAIKHLLKPSFPSDDDFQSSLFDGDDRIFKKLAATAGVYFEYGCGKSTLWTSHNSTAQIFAVDTSQQWALDTQSKQNPNNQLHIQWIDCGIVRDWGKPINFASRKNFRDYILGPFGMTSESPDLILVDGRFRVACFLTSLSRSKPGTSILFDDYADRPHYHVVEEFCPRPSFCGRQAIFTVPQAIDRRLLDLEIEKFTYVID